MSFSSFFFSYLLLKSCEGLLYQVWNIYNLPDFVEEALNVKENNKFSAGWLFSVKPNIVYGNNHTFQ